MERLSEKPVKLDPVERPPESPEVPPIADRITRDLNQAWDYMTTAEPIQLAEEDRERYGLRAVGPYQQADITVRVEGARDLPATEAAAKTFVDQFVARRFENINAGRVAEGKGRMTPGAKFNLAEVTETDGTVDSAIRQGEITYANFVVLGALKAVQECYEEYTDQLPDPSQAISYERFVELFRPQHPAVTALVITADGYVLYVKRDDRVGTHRRAFYGPSGSVETRNKNAAGQIDPLVALQDELREEVGLTLDQYREPVLMGIAVEDSISFSNFLYAVRTDLTHDQIVARPPLVEGQMRGEKNTILLPVIQRHMDGDVRAKRLFGESGLLPILEATLRIEGVYKNKRQEMAQTPDQKADPTFDRLTVDTWRTHVFLMLKMLEAAGVKE